MTFLFLKYLALSLMILSFIARTCNLAMGSHKRNHRPAMSDGAAATFYLLDTAFLCLLIFLIFNGTQ
ncbi:MAG: hypothetical protein AB7V18_19540 [Pyrinomonadaceae bacterium]